MVEHSQKILRARDQKEENLKLYESRAKIVQMDMDKVQKEFEKRKAMYEKWKLDNNIAGINYP